MKSICKTFIIFTKILLYYEPNIFLIALWLFLGTGTAGSYYDASARDFPAVPYSAYDFNDGNCYTSSGNIEDYGDANQVKR